MGAVRRGLDEGHWPGHDVLVVSARPGMAARLRQRLGALLRRARTSRGPVQVFVVEERATHPGNLVGTALAWEAACARARAVGLDLDADWRRGERTVAIVHGAGLGRRTAPLVHAEDGDRGGVWLPGRLAGLPARLLEAVVAQTAPLAKSQPAGFLDVLWASQLFLPSLVPEAVPAPTRALTKLVTSTTRPDADPDLGLFLLRDGQPTAFLPQGTPRRATGELAFDLGSFRLRADLLDVWRRSLSVSRGQAVDLDPHLTTPLLGGPDPLGEAARVRQALGPGELVGVTDLGADLPWWRLRRPRELRAAAMDLRPSIPEGAGLRELLGLDHPITRSWLGDTWVEGPELSWDDVREGVQIGGVVVQDSVVHDSALWGWRSEGRSPVRRPVVRRSVLSFATGGLAVDEAWIVATGSPGLRGGGGLAWRFTGDPPAAAGPSPTARGLCMVRRPRLRDGVAVLHDFLDEDAKATGHEPRPELGLSWSELATLAPFRGPPLPRRLPWPARACDLLDDSHPHVVVHPPATALALLRERLPPSTDAHRLLELAEDGALAIALHRGSRPSLGVDAPLAPGRRWESSEDAYLLHADLETWERWQWAPPRIAEALLHTFLTHFVGPGATPRTLRADAGVQAFRAGALTASDAVRSIIDDALHHEAPERLLGAIDRWELAEDPGRLDLSALFHALDDLDPTAAELAGPGELRAWLRWRLDHRQHDARRITADLRDAPAHVLSPLFSWSHPWVHGGVEHRVPRCDLRPPGPPTVTFSDDGLADHLADALTDLRQGGPAPTLGICGPAAAGKSSLAVAVAERLDARGLRVGFLSTDDQVWHGPGFRYDQHESTRTIRLYGPGIYDDVRTASTLAHLRATCDAVVAEGVYVGLDADVAARLDLRVAVVLEDRARLGAKASRDALGGRRRIDLVTDFSAKILHESRDGVAPLVDAAHIVWDRTDGATWLRTRPRRS